MTLEYFIDPLVYPGGEMLAVEFVGGKHCGELAGLPLGTTEWRVPMREKPLEGVTAVTMVNPSPLAELMLQPIGPVKLVELGVYRFGDGSTLVLRNSASTPMRLSALWAIFRQRFPALSHRSTVFDWHGEVDS